MLHRHARPRRAALIISLLAPVLFVAACGGSSAGDTEADANSALTSEFDEEALYKAAQSEDAATLYTPQTEESSQALVDAFKEKYPEIKEVQILRLSTVELGQRYEKERDSGVVAGDVVMSTDPNFMLAMDKKGYFADLSPTVLPNITQWPEEYVTDTFIRTVGGFPLGVIYNTDALGEDPFQDWSDLLDPKLKERLTIVDPRAIGTYQILANMLYEEYGADFLKGIASQVGTVVTSSIPGSQGVAAGEADALWVTNEAVRISLSKEGAPVKLFIPDYTTGSEHAAAISTATTKPNTARLFMNFLMSEDGQEAYAASGFSVLGPDVPGTVPQPEKYVSAWEQALNLPEERLNEIYGILGLQ
ncbi:ABC transporter substrate-binding protein [Actinophytocola sp.]|uniref:ABC transporter substrate-binding protein n=1 Tax=Actinophytocola sp. TaxID=1872138 RepID=UPI003D6AB5EE